MFRKLFACVGLVSLWGCAHQVQVAQAVADPAYNTTVRIDAGPGKIQRFSAELVQDERLHALFRMEKMQPSDKWGPRMMFCVHDRSEQVYSCVRFARYDGADHLIVELVDKESAAAEAKSVRTELLLPDFDPIDIQAGLEENTTVFWINGVKVMQRQMETVPTHYSYSCSSIICRVQLN